MKKVYAFITALGILCSSALCFGVSANSISIGDLLGNCPNDTVTKSCPDKICPDGTCSVYTVVKGDTLWEISLRYQIDLDKIIDANPQFEDPDLIYPGDKVYIPLPDSGVGTYEEQVVNLVNVIRKQNGLGALTLSEELCKVARYKSQDMHDRNYFSHTSPTYGSPFDMMKRFGISFRTAGENIAMGYRTPEDVVEGWMNSSGHRANILNAAYTQIGVGFVEDGYYWTQMFIG